MREEVESLKQQSMQLPELETVRDRILSNLKVGKQSPEYKRTKSLIERFIAQALERSSQ